MRSPSANGRNVRVHPARIPARASLYAHAAMSLMSHVPTCAALAARARHGQAMRNGNSTPVAFCATRGRTAQRRSIRFCVESCGICMGMLASAEARSVARRGLCLGDGEGQTSLGHVGCSISSVCQMPPPSSSSTSSQSSNAAAFSSALR